MPLVRHPGRRAPPGEAAVQFPLRRSSLPAVERRVIVNTELVRTPSLAVTGTLGCLRSLAHMLTGGTRRLLADARAATIGVVALAAGAYAAQQDQLLPVDVHRMRWWNIENGLPQSTINDLVQTENGELWIATFGGLLRFDGMSFRSYDLNTLPGLDSIRVTSLALDRHEGVWFGTQAGSVSHLVDGRIRETTFAPNRAQVAAVLQAGDGAVWALALHGAVSRFHAGKWEELLPGGAAGSYEGLCLGGDGSILVARGRELVQFAANGAELARMRAPARIESLCTSSEGLAWVGLEDGIAWVVRGRVERYPVRPAIDLRITALREDGQGALLIGTALGVGRIDTSGPRRAQLRVTSHELRTTTAHLRAMLVDREGNIWAGSADSGLYRMRPQRVETPGLERGFIPVTAICDDGNGGAWIGLGSKELGHVASGARMMTVEPLAGVAPSPAVVRSLCLDARDRLWVGVSQSWLRRGSEPGSEFERPLPSERFEPGTGPVLALDDGGVWLSSSGGRLVRLDERDAVLEEFDIDTSPNVLASGPQGEFWIGAENCVLRRHEGRLDRFSTEAGIPPGSVRDLLVEEDGAVWIATYGGGLARLENGRARCISRNEGLPDGAVTRILDDGYGRIWILSNLGLIVAERSELLDVLAGRRSRIAPVVFGPEAGMNEANYGQPAGFRSPSGDLWFGTIQSSVRIDPSRFPFNRVTPSTKIERLHADDEELPLADGVEVPAATRRIVFEFTAFALAAPERVRFRYQLLDYDEDWIDGSDQRRAAYTGLWPGRYVFRVLASNEEGVWGTRPAELAIVVLPSWWQTGWFGAAILLLIAGVLIGVDRLRVRVLDRRAAAELALARARAEAEQRESRLREELAHVARVATAGELATSLAHEVNQPLAAIATNAQAGRRYLARDGYAREDMDEILREIGMEAQRASEVIKRLRAFLRKHSSERRRLDLAQVVRDTLPLVRRELADNAVELVVELREAIPAVDADPVQLQQVLVNLVKNACEAMAGAKSTRRVELATQFAGGRVVLEVRDTGPGLSPDVAARLFEPFVTTKPTGMGLGLAICRSIVEAHGGNLSAAPGRELGTTFRIELPPGAFEEASA